MKQAIFPGTFEIFHDGHVHILKKALKIFDQILIVVAINDMKNSSALDKRFNDVKNKINELKIDNVLVYKWDSKLVEFAQMKNVCFIIRGVRNENDFLYEQKILNEYKKEWNEVEGIYFFSDENMKNHSSRNILNTNLYKK